MFEVGAICRSKDPVIKCEDVDRGRMCRVVAEVPEQRRRTKGVREFKVALLDLPVTAFRREHELILVAPATVPAEPFAEVPSGAALSRQPALAMS